MPHKPVILIDTNMILDVLQKREPFYATSVRLLAAAEIGRVKGYAASHSITTLFYLIKKDKSVTEARAVITNLLQFIKTAPVDQSTIEQALALDYRDYEDAVQMIAAMQCKAECIISRNVKDNQPALQPVMQPVDFLSAL
jgi:predicted nucleic acid-binding protein